MCALSFFSNQLNYSIDFRFTYARTHKYPKKNVVNKLNMIISKNFIYAPQIRYDYPPTPN